MSVCLDFVCLALIQKQKKNCKQLRALKINYLKQLNLTACLLISEQVENTRAILKKELDLALVEIADPKAKLEGGDVLFTGKEFFVGISEFTNESGARAVANAFPEFPCVPIKVCIHFANFIIL